MNYVIEPILSTGVELDSIKTITKHDYRKFKNLAKLYPKGESKEQFKERIKLTNPDSEFEEYKDYIIYHEFKFIFKNNKLIEVKIPCGYWCDDLGEDWD